MGNVCGSTATPSAAGGPAEEPRKNAGRSAQPDVLPECVDGARTAAAAPAARRLQARPPAASSRSPRGPPAPRSVEHKMRKGVSVRDVYKVGKTIGTGGAHSCCPNAC